MERPEALIVNNIRFLTLEEKRTLINRTDELGRASAKAGGLKITNNLTRLFNLAKNAKTATFVPVKFLESASASLWETGTDIDDIFSLYKKLFQTNISSTETQMEIDTLNELQLSFVNLAAKFTTEEKDPVKQKQTMTKSIDFLDKNSFDQQSKVEHLMYYGKYLFEHGMEKNGRKIIQTTAKLAPKTVSKLLDLKAILEQVREN